MKKVLVIILFLLGIGVIFLLMRNSTSDTDRSRIVTLTVDENLTDVKDNITSAVDRVDKERLDEVVDFVKEKNAEGLLKSQEGISKAIDEAEERFGAVVDDNTRQKIASSVEELENLGFSTDVIVDRTGELYEKYGKEFVDHIEEAFVGVAKDTAKNKAEELWTDFKEILPLEIFE